MAECKDCYWFYHVPECFADIKINGEYMCTNRKVKKIKVKKNMKACSEFGKIKTPKLRRAL